MWSCLFLTELNPSAKSRGSTELEAGKAVNLQSRRIFRQLQHRV